MHENFGGTPLGACLACGQHMRLPNALDANVACPRCGQIAKAIDLIPSATPVVSAPIQVVTGKGATVVIPIVSSPVEERPMVVSPSVTLPGAVQAAAAVPEWPTPPPEVFQAGPSPATYGEEASKEEGRTSGLLRFCAKIDTGLQGKRLKTISALVAFAGVGGPVLDLLLFDSRPVGTVIATNLLLLLLWSLLFAWLGGLRDDDGYWSGSLFRRRLAVHAADLVEAARDLQVSSVGALFVAVGCSALALRNVGTVVAVAFDAPSILSGVGEWLLGIGSGCFLLGTILLLKRLLSRAKASTAAVQSATNAAQALPAVIDMREVRSTQFGGSDPLQVTLQALSLWYSRKARDYEDEYGYQIALERHFRRYAKTLLCRREVGMAKSRKLGIADLTLGGIVLVEVKFGFSKKTHVNRAIGQMWDYCQTWPGKPKVLVIFGAARDDVFNSLATQSLHRLHREAATITVRM